MSTARSQRRRDDGRYPSFANGTIWTASANAPFVRATELVLWCWRKARSANTVDILAKCPTFCDFRIRLSHIPYITLEFGLSSEMAVHEKYALK